MNNNQFPTGWSAARIGDLCHLINGRAFKPNEWAKSGLPIVRIQNLNNPESPFNYCDKDVEDKFFIDPGELLFAWSGTPGTSFGAHIWKGPRAVLNQHIFRVLINENNLNKDFFRIALNQRLVTFIEKAHGGVGLGHITKGKFEDTTLCIPPLNEQRRIVSKLESLLARSRRAKEALDAIPALLERFRQSVLAAAFRGDLTADWRAQQKPTQERWWELLRAEATKSKPPAESRSKRLWGSGRTTDDIQADWGPIPQSWRWVRLSELGSIPEETVQIGPMSMQSSAFVASGVPVLNVGCVQQGFIETSKCNYLPEAASSEFARYQLKCDDILLTRSGSIGRAATVPAALEGALMTFHLIRIRTEQNLCLPRYLQYALLGAIAARKQLEGSAIGATRAGLNTRLVADMWVPLAPPAEQHKIVETIDLAFARLNKLTATRLLLQKQIGLLDSTVLAKAFRGELVPQDPNDEPASVLLERIRTEREAHAGSAPKRSRGRSSAA